MSKKPFVPPIPYVEPPSEETIEKLSKMTKNDIKNFKKSDAYTKYVAPVLKAEKESRKKRRKEWWKNNWIALLSLLFAFIAAPPVILQGIIAMLKLLG